MIINLQRIGEHPYCGIEEKLEQISGFTYVPEDFIMEGIDCKVFGLGIGSYNICDNMD